MISSPPLDSSLALTRCLLEEETFSGARDVLLSTSAFALRRMAVVFASCIRLFSLAFASSSRLPVCLAFVGFALRRFERQDTFAVFRIRALVRIRAICDFVTLVVDKADILPCKRKG